MRQFSVASLATIAILASIGGAAYALQVAHYRNIPGPVTGSYSSGIKGSFRIVPVNAPDGIPSIRSGGACIVFRAQDLGFTKMSRIKCNADSDCATSENPVGYCSLPSGKCWSKPLASAGADRFLCRRSPTPLPANTTIQISPVPAPIATPSWNIRHNARARVVTRLNCIGGAPCAPDGRAFVHELGQPKQL